MEGRFRICAHDLEPGKMMVEYWRGKEFAAGIYSHEDGIRIVSKYMTGVSEDRSFPPAAVIFLGKGPALPGETVEPATDIKVKFANVEKAPGGLLSFNYIPNQPLHLEAGKRYRIVLEGLTYEVSNDK